MFRKARFIEVDKIHSYVAARNLSSQEEERTATQTNWGHSFIEQGVVPGLGLHRTRKIDCEEVLRTTPIDV